MEAQKFFSYEYSFCPVSVSSSTTKYRPDILSPGLLEKKRDSDMLTPASDCADSNAEEDSSSEDEDGPTLSSASQIV